MIIPYRLGINLDLRRLLYMSQLKALTQWLGRMSTQRSKQREIQQHWQKLYAMAYAWTHDVHLSKDLVQETLSKAWRNRHQLQDENAVHAWLYRILANCWHDMGRKKRDFVNIDDIELMDHDDPENQQQKKELIARVRQALQNLSADQRQVITLIDLEEYSYGEVADILQVPIGTVMSRLCRARRKLLAEIKQDEDQIPRGQVVPIK